MHLRPEHYVMAAAIIAAVLVIFGRAAALSVYGLLKWAGVVG